MRVALKWALIVTLVLGGLYLLSGGIMYADYSVPAKDPIMVEAYKTRALILMPLSLLYLLVAAALLIFDTRR